MTLNRKMRIHTFDPETAAAILAGEPCSVPVPHPLAAEHVAIHNGTDIVGRAYLPGTGTTTITADAIEHAADLVDGEKVCPICYSGEFVLWRDVLPTGIESLVMEEEDDRVTIERLALKRLMELALEGSPDWCPACSVWDIDTEHDPGCPIGAARRALRETAEEPPCA